MASDIIKDDVTVNLVEQIMACLVIADAEQLYTVGAHLNMALVALQGTGLSPLDTVLQATV